MIKDLEVFEWLQAWYQSQCNERWEHGYGITIETFFSTIVDIIAGKEDKDK